LSDATYQHLQVLLTVEHQIREENNLLKQNLHVLENENEEMKEIIEELMENQEISTFEKGKYNDTVREVYAALLL
jgi:hypothetical protein